MEQEQTEADVIQQLTGYFEGQAAPEEEAVEEGPQVVAEEQPEQTEEVQAEEATTEDAGLVELELEDGSVEKVSPKVREGYLRTADYTRKTQEVAALTKSVQAAQRQQALVAQFQAQTTEDREALAQAKADLARFKNIDWTGLDTDTILKTRIHIDGLRDKIQDLESGLNQKAQKVQQDFMKMRGDAERYAREYISKHAKDWIPGSKVDNDMADYAHSQGLDKETFTEISILYPQFAVNLYKARQFDKLQASKGQAVQKVQNAPPVVKPGGMKTQSSAAAQRTRDLQGRFQKSGSIDDMAALLLAKGMVK